MPVNEKSRDVFMCKTLIIDNFDSFTYNLYQYMGEICGEEPDVVNNNESYSSLRFDDYDCIIISPGPGRPSCSSDVGISAKIIEEISLPILGVCLGHQTIAYVHGMDVVRAPEPVHGRVSRICHAGKGVFQGLPQELSVVRYHSLVVGSLREPFDITAWGGDGLIHGIQHRTKPIHGIQFHPESICSDSGMDLLRNFKNIAISEKAKHLEVRG